MIEHPGTQLQLLIKEKGLTQKAFASILGKKVSEVNELLKGKRNITIQRDYLLHQTIGTPIKYWILKQVDYDYSLLDIEETKDNNTFLSDSLSSGVGGKSTSQETSHSEHSEESNSNQNNHSESEKHENPSNTTPMDFSLQSKRQDNLQDFYPVNETSSGLSSEGQTSTQETSIEESPSKNGEDLQNRAKIFRTF